MKTIQIVEVYQLLKDLSISGMTFKGQRAILKNLRNMKPVAESYSTSIEDAQARLKPDGFEWIEEIAQRHNEAVRTGQEEGLLKGKELQEVNEFYHNYNEAVSSYVEELNSEEVDLDIETMDEEDFEKLVVANEKLEAGKLALLDEILL